MKFKKTLAQAWHEYILSEGDYFEGDEIDFEE